MQHNDLRNSFLDYFKQKNHKIVASSPVIPYDDPTLMFTNAGMNQFKEVLVGNEKRSYTRATSVQKCIRVSGKHNDFEIVGFDGTHHTFFEMLGNWSFGDYYKKEAIEFAWEYLTNVLKLPEEKLFVSTYKDDTESYNIWNKVIHLPASKIVKLGDIENNDDENFWSMGETGPCGPCTEIYYDMGDKYSDTSEGEGVGYDKRYVELWNLVFMEFYRDNFGKLIPLKMKSVDTGMGFERLYSLLNGKDSNYHTDLFLPIIEGIEEISGKKYRDKNNEVAFQVISDHIRALSFAIADGGMFSNEGRGYILRKIIRRAERYLKKLGVNEPALYKLVDNVADVMGDFYTEINEKKEDIKKFIRLEEEKFIATLESGLKMINSIFMDMKKENKSVMDGKKIFNLYDTYGFPVDIIKEIAKEKNFSIDEDGFKELMNKQKELGRKSWKGSKQIIDEENILKLLNKFEPTDVRCYESLETVSNIVAIINENKLVKESKEGDEIGILLDITPFYAESGGQVGDKGTISTPEFNFEVYDTQKYGNRYFVHWGRVEYGSINRGAKVDAKVNKKLRQATARNHTATHLLQAALRKTIGTHITQAGSYVGPDRLRFDFRHYTALTVDEIEKVEKLVNEKIIENIKIEKSVKEKEEAIKSGAMAIFGEKYGEKVRVIKADNFSNELCGGTHIDYTGEIGVFLIVSESSIASGVRRIEAITGETAFNYIEEIRTKMKRITDLFKVSLEQVDERIESLIKKNKELEKKTKMISSSSNGDIIDTILKSRIDKNRASLIIYKFKNENVKYLNSLADRVKKKINSGAILFININEDKANLILTLTDDIVNKGNNAADILNPIASIIGGSGGGRNDRAQAGGKKIDKIDKMIDVAKNNLLKIL